MYGERKLPFLVKSKHLLYGGGKSNYRGTLLFLDFLMDFQKGKRKT